MEYDHDSVKAAKKEGVFDSSTDPDILVMDKKEKRKLVDEFKKNLNKNTGNFDNREENNLKFKNGKERDLSLWERLLFFFQKLFLGLSKEGFIKKQDLKHIKAMVKKSRPAIYLFGSNRISGHFAQMLLELAGRVSIFKQVFEICDKENRPGPESPGSFIEFFVRQFIEDITDLQKTFSYSYILEERHIFQEERIRKTVENEVDKLLSGISHEVRQKINYLYANLLGIERLSEYNFYSVLRKFGEGYSAFNNNVPLFGNVAAYEVRFDLKKLESLIFSIDLTASIETPLEIMINFYKNITSDENEEDLQTFADNDIEKLIESILGLIHEEKLSNLIRLSSGNPYHVPTLKIRQVNIIDKFRIQLIKRYIPHCQTILHQIEMDELKRQIDALFGNTPLSSLEFYNETTNKKLINFDLPVFSNCRYMQILKTYTERLFNAVIKPSLNIIVVDGNFIDNTLYKKLSNFFPITVKSLFLYPI